MLKMKVLQSFQKSVTIYQSQWCNILEAFNLQQYCYDNLKSVAKSCWTPVVIIWVSGQSIMNLGINVCVSQRVGNSLTS